MTLKGCSIGLQEADSNVAPQIYDQLSIPPKNFTEAQPLWENALKTLKTE